MEATEKDDESVVGDECHIISKKENGPRGNLPLPADKRDLYENLILSCRTHHKLIDDQCETFTVELLKQLKANHEKWVWDSLNAHSKEDNSDQFLVYRIDNGRQLTNVVGGSLAFQFDNDQLDNETEKEFVSIFAQMAFDLMEFWDDLESGRRVEIQYEFDKEIAQLNEIGFVVYGCQRNDDFIFQSQPITDWSVAHIFVFRNTNPLLSRKEEALEKLYSLSHLYEHEYTNFVPIQHKQM